MKNCKSSLFLLFSLTIECFAQNVKIGNQVWMTKNLDVDTFRNGEKIPEAKTAEEWVKAGENKQPAWCYYKNDSTNGTKYGKLYNWYVVNDSRGLEPTGWHVPSEGEWTQLVDNLGGADVAGIQMKSKSEWKEGSNGTNGSGFSGLPGGNRLDDGVFNLAGDNGCWWSSTVDSFAPLESTAWCLYLYHEDGSVIKSQDLKNNGLSVRCLMNNLHNNFKREVNFESNSEVEPTQAHSVRQVYPEVKIGNQVWMAKNLDVSTFRNGDPIPEAETDEEWVNAAKYKQPAWCYYDNDPANGVKYGKLYNWYAVSDHRGLSPKGWHIPSDDEWTVLFNYLGGKFIAPEKMKSTDGWYNNGNGTNTSGFSGLPGGGRDYVGSFVNIGKYGSWWNSSENYTNFTHHSLLFYIPDYLDRSTNDTKQVGFSVRCLRD